MACAAPSPASPLLPALADYLDCHAQALSEAGAQTLAGGVIVPALLTSCLVVYVALVGYRLMLGEEFGVRDAVLSIARIALVITFCTRWPSYEAVIYRVVTDGPREVASAILTPSGLPVLTISDTAQRIQAVTDLLQTQGVSPVAPKGPFPDPGASASIFPANPGGTAVVSPPQQAANSLPQQGGNGGAGVPFMASSLGGLLAVRLAGAVVLAVGPLIIALALFDSLLGLFEGWARALVGVALAAMGLQVLVALELAFVEAQLSATGADGSPAFTGQSLMLVAAVFTLVELGMLVSVGFVASGFKLPRVRQNLRRATPAISGLPVRLAVAAPAPATPSGLAPSSRAQAVADAVTVQGQRERALFAVRAEAAPGRGGPGGSVLVTRGSSEPIGPAQALGSSLRRSPASRRSPNISRRSGIR